MSTKFRHLSMHHGGLLGAVDSLVCCIGSFVAAVTLIVLHVSPVLSCGCVAPYVSGVSTLALPGSPVLFFQHLVSYVTVVLPLVAPVSLRFSDPCVAPWHTEV